MHIQTVYIYLQINFSIWPKQTRFYKSNTQKTALNKNIFTNVFLTWSDCLTSAL